MPNNRRMILSMICGKISYTPIDFIISNGQQVLDTGITPDDTTEVEYYGKILNTSHTSIMGCGWFQPPIANQNRFHFYSDVNADKYFYTGTDGYPYGTFSTDTLSKYKMKKGGLYVNDVLKIRSNNSIKNNLNIWIFNGNNNGNKMTTTIGKFECFGIKIWKQGNLVRDMIPVLDVKQVPCMFDLVEKKFYYEKDGGSFEKGTSIKTIYSENGTTIETNITPVNSGNTINLKDILYQPDKHIVKNIIINGAKYNIYDSITVSNNITINCECENIENKKIQTMLWDFTSEHPEYDKVGINTANILGYILSQKGATIQTKSPSSKIAPNIELPHSEAFTISFKLGTPKSLPIYNRFSLIQRNNQYWIGVFYNGSNNPIENTSNRATSLSINDIFEKTFALSIHNGKYRIFVDGELRVSGDASTNDFKPTMFCGGSSGDYADGFNIKKLATYNSPAIWEEEDAKANLL